MKNSSRLLLVMARNLRRSRAGTEGSEASSRTRSLNESQDSSRLMNKRESTREGAGRAGSGGGTTDRAAARAWAGWLAGCVGAAARGVGAPSMFGLYMRGLTEARDIRSLT